MLEINIFGFCKSTLATAVFTSKQHIPQNPAIEATIRNPTDLFTTECMQFWPSVVLLGCLWTSILCNTNPLAASSKVDKLLTATSCSSAASKPPEELLIRIVYLYYIGFYAIEHMQKCCIRVLIRILILSYTNCVRSKMATPKQEYGIQKTRK